MLAKIALLQKSYDSSYAILKNAEHAGMEVSLPLFELGEAKTALIKSRAAIHGFDQALLDKEVGPGVKISEKSHERGVRALDELQFRRKGLAVSAVIIFALVIGLIFTRDLANPFAITTTTSWLWVRARRRANRIVQQVKYNENACRSKSSHSSVRANAGVP